MKIAAAVGLSLVLGSAAASAATPERFTVAARADGATFEAVGAVEAVRQGTIASQVSGRITQVLVRNGDEVKSGQPLIQIEADEARDAEVASSASAAGAQARLAVARADYERAQRLRAQEFISVAAMQRAEAALRSAEAESQAAAAAAQAAHTRAGWHVVRAPYAGHITRLAVSAGDLATPGRELLALYDPAALRVKAQIPESMGAHLLTGTATSASWDGGTAKVPAWRVIPAVDAVTHSIEVQLDLPAGTAVEPGQFVTLSLPVREAAAAIRVPLRAVVHRSEVTGVYVLDAHDAAHLRQVRLGAVDGDMVTVLAGLQGGEQVALDPIRAALH